jgi:hypothetical protein
MDAWDFLQNWYSNHCDGDWEHSDGVSITTLDNPGWALTIDIAKTELAGKPFSPISRNLDSQMDWIQVFIHDGKFEARGGPGNFREMLEVFRDWASS